MTTQREKTFCVLRLQNLRPLVNGASEKFDKNPSFVISALFDYSRDFTAVAVLVATAGVISRASKGLRFFQRCKFLSTCHLVFLK
jgi:TRAP-type uncharacterized transport system fused permease subunit